jgi:hypothetical protein
MMKHFALASLALVLLSSSTPARDQGQWEATDADVRAWYRDLKQPDNPRVTCCGEADAYWADSFEVHGDQYVAIITDERADSNLGRPPIAVGTRILVPNYKLKTDAGNPTGHGVIFVGGGQVLCYVAPGGG